VALEDSKGKRTKLNHFNKKAKGQFVRAALMTSPTPKSVSDLKAVAQLANLKLEVSGNQLVLITYG
jgi:cytoplasmic iron level regulating protein YaaA (DUF328/UPF0246 family)